MIITTSAFMRNIVIAIAFSCFISGYEQAFAQQELMTSLLELNKRTADHFASLAQGCIQKPYPYKAGHVIRDSADNELPIELHPAFYGCFDWHSSVHGHWMLVRLLKLFPQMDKANEIRKALNDNLSRAKLDAEAAYFRRAGTKSFERTYGWAWLLKLVEELEGWEDADGMRWRSNIRGLEKVIVNRYLDFLPRQEYPIRTGEHPNTAFGLAFAWDYAKKVSNQVLLDLIEVRAKDYYLMDEHCPASWEPGGADFLSPCLEEADFMRRILPVNEYREWLRAFLPGIEEAKPLSLFKPVNVSDRTDPKIVHLDGLNLSRAWCLYGIRNTIYHQGDTQTMIEQAADAHLRATLPHITSGDYAGEHWLGSFAVYALSVKER